MSAATKARQHANKSRPTARQKTINKPETLSADDELSASSALPAAMLAEDKDCGDTCRIAVSVVDNQARQMTSLLTTPQPIRRQSDEAGHMDVVPVADTPK